MTDHLRNTAEVMLSNPHAWTKGTLIEESGCMCTLGFLANMGPLGPAGPLKPLSYVDSLTGFGREVEAILRYSDVFSAAISAVGFVTCERLSPLFLLVELNDAYGMTCERMALLLGEIAGEIEEEYAALKASGKWAFEAWCPWGDA